MYFTKFILVLVVALVLYMNFSDAGQAGSTAAKTAQKVIKGAAKNAPKVVAGGYAANSTFNVNVNTKPRSRSSSPKGKRT